MKAFKEKGFAERRDAAAKAKEDNLKKFSKKDRQPLDAPTAAGKGSGKDAASAPAKKSAGKSKKG